jgi:hypothetical protein
MTADRARRLDENLRVELDHDEFVESLTQMCAAVVAG